MGDEVKPTARQIAVFKTLRILREPLRLLAVPEREEVDALVAEHGITVADLIALARRRSLSM